MNPGSDFLCLSSPGMAKGSFISLLTAQSPVRQNEPHMGDPVSEFERLPDSI